MVPTPRATYELQLLRSKFQPPFYLRKFCQKSKIKKEKFKDEVIFGDFEFPEVKKNLPT
jgi:hypothetical protein